MYAMFVLMATGGLLVTAQAAPIARTSASDCRIDGDVSRGGAAWAPRSARWPTAPSGITWGGVSDSMGRENTMILTFVLQAISLFLVVAVGSTSAVMFSVTMVLVYFTWGQIYSLFPATSATTSGPKHATSNYAVLYTREGRGLDHRRLDRHLLYEQTGSWTTCLYGARSWPWLPRPWRCT